MRAHRLQTHRKRFNLLLLVRESGLKVLPQLRDRRFQFLHLFDALSETRSATSRSLPHIAYSINIAVFITNNQIGVHLFHFLGHWAELCDALRVDLFLVTKMVANAPILNEIAGWRVWRTRHAPVILRRLPPCASLSLRAIASGDAINTSVWLGEFSHD